LCGLETYEKVVIFGGEIKSGSDQTADAFDECVTGSLEDGHGQDNIYKKSTHVSPILSPLPRVKLPKHTSSIQEDDRHLPGRQINSDSFSSTTEAKPIPSIEAVPEQEDILEGVNTDLFYSPRIAKLLGGKTQPSFQGELKLRGAEETPVDHTELGTDKDQDTFNVRHSSKALPSLPEPSAALDLYPIEKTGTSKQEIKDLAQELSKETKTPEVRPILAGWDLY
jgi:aarF domain-containing kinase